VSTGALKSAVVIASLIWAVCLRQCGDPQGARSAGQQANQDQDQAHNQQMVPSVLPDSSLSSIE